jgi:hypothetical protein
MTIRIPGLRSAIIVLILSQSTAPGSALADGQGSGPDHSKHRLSPFSIHTKYGLFDPLAGELSIPPELRAVPDNTIRLVQVTGRLESAEIEALEDAGARLLGYVPFHTYVASVPARDLDRVRSLPAVRWVGELHAAFRIDPLLLQNEQQELVLRVECFPDEAGDANRDAVRSLINAFSGEVLAEHFSIPVLRARVHSAALLPLARLTGVRWVEQWHPPQAAMDNGRYQLGARALHVNRAFDGSGIVGEVKDSGIDLTHPDFGNLIGLHGDVVFDLHGTGTFGIVFADGGAGTPSSLMARGMMTGGSGVFCSWGVNRADSMLNLAEEWDGRFQTNSWTAGNNNGLYTGFSREDDLAINLHDILMLYAGGNNGIEPMKISQDACAKNVIGVGGILHYNNDDPGDDEWIILGGAPAQGPAADGRVKPDLVAYVDKIFTTDPVGSEGLAAGDYTADFGGTSGACPMVAGAAGLVYQMFEEGHLGSPPSRDRAHTATVKAILVAHANQYPLERAARFQQGWGIPDVSRIHAAGRNMLVVNGGHPLAIGESRTFQVRRYAAGEPLRISLVWADREAEVLAEIALVNDLDLKVTSPSGTVYRGNHGLIEYLWSVESGEFDRRNNVENVFIADPEPGTYTVEVLAWNVPLDNHPDAGINQDFSLCATMVEGNPSPFIVTGPGPYNFNDPLVRTWDPQADSCLVEWKAYSRDRYGVNVATGDTDGDGIDEVITGAGPGAVFGPHVRGFSRSGQPLSRIDFLAYGTNKYGVNVATGDLDGNGADEIVTGAGPGEVFGPHVRGWTVDADGAAPLAGVSYFAYGTPKYGVNVSCGDIDGDGVDEIVTGAGPGTVYGAHVRGWNVDGGTAAPIPVVSFFAYGTPRWGVRVACGDIDGDGLDEMITGPGPGVEFGPHLRAFDFDGSAVTAVQGLSQFVYSGYLFGLNVGTADVDGDGFAEILTMPGPDPEALPWLRIWDADSGALQLNPDFDFDAYDELNLSHGGTVAGGIF